MAYYFTLVEGIRNEDLLALFKVHAGGKVLIGKTVLLLDSSLMWTSYRCECLYVNALYWESSDSVKSVI